MKKHENDDFTIADIEEELYIRKSDVMFTLDEMKMLKFSNGKYYLITDAENYYIKKYRRDKVIVRPEKIHWVPYKTVNTRNKRY